MTEEFSNCNKKYKDQALKKLMINDLSKALSKTNASNLPVINFNIKERKRPISNMKSRISVKT